MMKLAVLCIALCASSAWGDDKPPTKPPTKPPAAIPMMPKPGGEPEAGDRATVLQLGTPGATTLEVFAEFGKPRKANDLAGMKSFYSAKTVVTLAKGTSLLVIKPYFEPVNMPASLAGRTDARGMMLAAEYRASVPRVFPVEVRVLDGEFAEKALFVSMQDLVILVPDPDASSGGARAKKPKTVLKAKPVDPSARARSLLKSAEVSALNGNDRAAAELYKQLVKDFPDTPEAKIASARLTPKP